MGVLQFLALITCCMLLQQCEEISAGTWSMPMAIKGYASYLDVTPLKYHILPGTSQASLEFMITRSSPSCAKKTVQILIKHGSLPHVIQTNLTFPDNFVVDGPDLTFLMVEEQEYSHTLFWPKTGPLFVVAYMEKEEKAIKQKGLSDDSDNCRYYFTSYMDNEVIAPSIAVDYKEDHQVTIRNVTLFRFQIPKSTMSFKIQLKKCDPSPCSLTLAYQPNNESFANTQMCNGSAQDCSLEVASPTLTDVQFLQIRNEAVNKSARITFSISVTECSHRHGGQCLTLQQFDRVESSQPLSTAFGYISPGDRTSALDLHWARHFVVPFEILDPNDIGGTLGWSIIDLSFAYDLVQSVQFCGTLYHDYLPVIKSDFDLCTNMSSGINHTFTMASQEQPSLYVPYPKAGIWHMVFRGTCFNGSRSEIPCPEDTYLMMILSIQPCWNNGCTDKGSCMLGSITSDLIFYAACRCDAKYQGYACTDDTYAESISVQLAAACLLTMSNFFFVPAIIIACKRRYFVEAFVYFFNMFFSTFYHACDGSRLDKYRLCIIEYDVLQISDFFGSACSLWITLVAMARIRQQYLTPLLQIMGPFCLLIGVVYDKTSLWVIAAPIISGVVVIATSWGYKMYKRRKLYPSWRRYVFFLLPGLVLAAIGASVFSFLETEDNYKYVHSVWHMCIALSICLFLPPRHQDEYGNKLDSQSNTSREPLTPAVNLTLEDTGEVTNRGYVNETP